jgi:hypothetical protein
MRLADNSNDSFRIAPILMTPHSFRQHSFTGFWQYAPVRQERQPCQASEFLQNQQSLSIRPASTRMAPTSLNLNARIG